MSLSLPSHLVRVKWGLTGDGCLPPRVWPCVCGESCKAGHDGCPDKPQTEAVLPLVPPVDWGTAAHILGQPEISSAQILVLSPGLEARVFWE